MEESLILSKFDDLVKSGLVQYDNKQEIIEYIDGDLKVYMNFYPLYICIALI